MDERVISVKIGTDPDCGRDLVGGGDPRVEHGLVVDRPLSDRQLGNLNRLVVNLLELTRHSELVVRDPSDGSLYEVKRERKGSVLVEVRLRGVWQLTP